LKVILFSFIQKYVNIPTTHKNKEEAND